ncbi:MAG TPA: tRNA lysidine(34) synthetase TilS, partial [Bacteroidetes bacterium]|nr:tRNA lysidine(34) synthetase TilS [Bacteroidota bacterium]
LNYRPAVAHVNFQLRGKDSEGDETFVRDFCAEKSLRFFSTRFDTQKEAEKEGESIQMAARRLRYSWLFALMDEHGFKRVITAHHDRDQAETLLLNLMRGTGPLGLQGMVVDDGRLFRPMLRMEYPSIVKYAKQFQVAHREDISNAETKYKRNFIRHFLVKPWEERYPGTIRQISKSSEWMEEANAFMFAQLDKEARPFIHRKKDRVFIDYQLANHPSANLLMRHILKEYGLAEQAAFILPEHSRPGAIFSSKTHALLADREHWIIRRSRRSTVDGQQSTVNGKIILTPITHNQEPESISVGSYGFLLRPTRSGEPIPKDNTAILLSNELLQSGLYFRHWQEGDKMKPFGMKGNKKLSDILIDAGIDRFTKASIPVLCDKKGNILWLAGVRSSELLRLKEVSDAAWVLEKTD